MMSAAKTIFYLLVAGALGGFTSGIVVWALGAGGVTPALGFNMVPDLNFGWMARRMFASALWGIIFLIPIYRNSAVLKGAVLGILPWLSSILVVFPYKMHVGFFGLGMGAGTPVWTLFFGMLWGVTGTLFLAKFRPELKLRLKNR
jgi:hypothetical protein